MTRRCRTAYAAALFAVAHIAATSPVTARAEEWRHVESPPPEPLVPRLYGNGDGDTLWIVTSDGVRCSVGGHVRAVRRSADGPRLPEDAVHAILPLDDGGVLLDVSGVRGNLGGYCAAERIAVDGRAPWRAELSLGDENCRGYIANEAGQGWFLAAQKLFPVDPDGRIGTRPAIVGEPPRTRPAVVLDDGGIVTATRLRGETGSRLARFDTQGVERWHWVRSDQKPLGFVTIAGDGIVAAAMGVRVGYGDDVSRWNLDGQLQWTRAPPPQTDITGIIPAAGGDVYVVLSDGFAHAAHVQRIGADGGLRWQATPYCMTSTAFALPVARTSDDGLALACGLGYGSSITLMRLDRDGTQATALPLPIDIAVQVLPQRDGRLLILGLHTAPLQSRPIPRTLRVVGTQVSVDEPLRDTAPVHLVGQQILADGSTVIATAPEPSPTDSGSFMLTRVGADGVVSWRQRLFYRPHRGSGALATGAGLACVALDSAAATSMGGGTNGVVCVDAERGEERWQTWLPTDGTTFFNALSVGSDGHVRLLRSLSNSHELFRMNHDGVLGHTARGIGLVQHAAFSDSGRVVVMTPDALLRYTPEGSPEQAISAGATPIAFMGGSAGESLIVADDGSAWMLGLPATPDASGRRIWAIAPDGRTRWTRDLPTAQPSSLLRRGDGLYAVGVREDSRGNDRSMEVTLTRMHAGNGAVDWTRTDRHWPFTLQGSAITVSPNARAIVLAHSEFSRMHLERLNADDGSRLNEIYLACNGSCGIPAALGLDDDGTARVAFDVNDRELGQTAAVTAADLARPSTRLDQPGIAGAWWSPYANGEGIAFDWLPASRTLFGAWFTYSTAGGNEPSELRWYTLQANGVGIGARELTLPILETIGGNFAAGPPVSPRQVGSATLAFHDCSKATLTYAFDAGHNDARSGTISLSRLSPATQPCVLADGSTAPAPGAAPPSNGFDARLSGTWFEAATAGQGLQFTVQPGGVFFAPWFTFDPLDAANDPGQQHWFTLQGNLADARNGTAELVLVQTIGGRFDSVPTYNANAVGSATLRVQGCDRAELDYRFDDAPGGGAFRGLHGTLQLARAGGCAP